MAGNNLVSSFRRVTAIPTGAVHDTVLQALRDHDKGLLDLQTAIPLLKSQIDALKTATASTTTTVISGGGGGGSSFPNGIGTLSNQTGLTAYTMQTTDNGALVLFSDASPVAVTLNTAVNPPYFFYAVNWGAGLVTFTPPSPTTISYINNLGAASMTLATGYLTMIVFDGANFWAATLPVVPETFAAVAHEFLNSYSAVTGLFTAAQPTANDIANPYVAVTATYAALTTDYRIEATSGTFTITLPDGTTVAVGKTYSIKNSGTGTITVATTASQTIDGQLTQTLTQWDNLVVYWNGSAWRIE